MSHATLTTRYRPQTFADLAGQETLKAILSRAAAEDKVAPAYLFSGTRGVGKTTIARIFAKALNCRNPVQGASGREPCNKCELCLAITQGSSVDVVEIDGASNRGIDDVRRLKESVGYAPMESRYKIFIIDEAHMLSREAFNALLKTLEEPPARVTFIMATTEPHKFPVTIISRCQHYVFKRLGDAELEAHLKKVLGAEQQTYEEAALRLLVRRAAGSVRDAMSLLGQVLALGGQSLSEADTRTVLGLAGQELFFKLITAIKEADCAALSLLTRDMLDQGIDLGFFLRELTTTWRNLFMLRQIGAGASPLLELPQAEAERWRQEAESMELAHIHACWQLTLEGQRRVLTSLEPSMALELLLFNLAMLPRLISLEQLSGVQRKSGVQAQSTQTGNVQAAEHQSHASSNAAPVAPGFAQAEKKSPLSAETTDAIVADTKADKTCETQAQSIQTESLQAEQVPSEPVQAVPPAQAKSVQPRPQVQAKQAQPGQLPVEHQQTKPTEPEQPRPARSAGSIRPTAPPVQTQQNRDKIRAELEELTAVKALRETLGAELVDYGAWYNK